MLPLSSCNSLIPVAPRQPACPGKVRFLQNRNQRCPEPAAGAGSTSGPSTRLLSGAWGLITPTVLLCLLLFSAGCRNQHKTVGPVYGNKAPAGPSTVLHFAVHPLYNPAKMITAYQPLMDYLNKRMNGIQFILEASRDYQRYEKKIEARQPEILLPNPLQTIKAMKAGYRVIAFAGDPADFKGLFIVRKDGGIRVPGDLRGKAVSYPSPTALAACIMPEYYLHIHGIDVKTEIKSLFVGSQESSIMNVYLKKTAAGATWPPPWRTFQKDHPAESAELEAIWETRSLISNSVMIRNDIPGEIGKQLQDQLSTLSATEEGRKVLSGMETLYFKAATDADYSIVETYIRRFEKEVHKIESL
ncbi:MAG: phosphate/phosphite/phosphonate ABC transporter substrate-binding protein [Sphingobacteriales bacterium]|nr:phosphate/phosphite/phosphonate ABC transporter substrate-binding protein [Sphingobacteriales bacterium]